MARGSRNTGSMPGLAIPDAERPGATHYLRHDSASSQPPVPRDVRPSSCETDGVHITQASKDDIQGLAHLLWLDTVDTEAVPPSIEAFAGELAQWWADHQESHFAFIARSSGSEIVGMAWVAMISRIPRPEATKRLSADIQTVFVTPAHRGRGVGSALVRAAADHASNLGAVRVTVHSGRKAVQVYERLGFASSPQLLQRPPKQQ